MIETPRIIETTFHVRYAETDAMGIVHHSSYVIYLEESRSNYIRQCGSSYADMERDGFFLGVVELNVRYLRPARFDDLITIRTQIETIRSRSLTFGYELINAETKDKLLTGTTKHICTNLKGEATRIPEKWLSWLSG